MFSNRKLAKRSIIGTRVSALWQDGRFYPGSITNYSGEEGLVFGPKYTVEFDDGYTKEVRASEIVGPGFQTLSSVNLKHGQKLYLTLNGREVPGVVIDHDRNHDVVIVDVKVNGDEIEIERRTEDVRLIESRKSARLVDQDTDYSKLADFSLTQQNENKRSRTVSHVIDVPTKLKHRGPSVEIDDRDSSPENDDVEMDDHVAAMVLTSLSCSPVSPHFPLTLTEKSQPLSTSANSSGFHSEPRSDPSPPLSSHLSESCPTHSGLMLFSSRSPGKDDGIYDDINDYPEPKRKRSLGMTKTMFQCTWKGCGKVHNTESAIEKHVRTSHLGAKDSDSDMSDREEEFYYTEIEVNVDNVTKTFSDMFTSSPPETNFLDRIQYIPDHEYQRRIEVPDNQKDIVEMKEHSYSSHMHASSVPSGDYFPQGLTTPPISMPQMKRSLSWQNSANMSPTSAVSPPIRLNKMSPQDRLQQHQAQSPKSHMFGQSPKSQSILKKQRSEVRKCRKVYGMENRDMWCTQCKWKKACSRFVD